MVPIPRNRAPNTTSNGNSLPAPVAASEDGLDPVPEFPVVPADNPEELVPDAAAFVAVVVVVVVVVPEGDVVVVVVEPAATAVNVTVTRMAERSMVSVVSVAV